MAGIIANVSHLCIFSMLMSNIMSNSSTLPEYSSERSISGPQVRDHIQDELRNQTQEDVSSTRYVPNVSQCAFKDQTFCTTDATYPLSVIDKILQKDLHKYADVFNSDSLGYDDVGFRLEDVDEIPLCESHQRIIFPTSGTNENGDELYIFNTAKHKQGVRVSICHKKGSSCKFAEILPIGFRTECKQQLFYRELLSLSPEGVPIKDKFAFPACCSCTVYRGT